MKMHLRSWWEKKLYVRGIFWGILLFAILRAIGGDGFLVREFWFDEAYSGNVVRMPWREMFAMLQRDIHPPLYYMLLKLWGTMFGFGDIALRSFSVFIYAGFLATLFVLLKKITNNLPFALLSLVFFAANPFVLQYAQEARMYMLLAFLVLLAFLFFWQAVTASEQSFSRMWLGFACTMGFALLTHYTAFIVLFAFGIVWAWQQIVREHVPLRAFLLLAAQVGIIIFLLFLPWLPIFLQHLERGSSLDWNSAPRWFDIFAYAHIFLYGTAQGTAGGGVPRAFDFSLSPIASGAVILVIFAICVGFWGRLVPQSRTAFSLFGSLFLVTITGFVFAEMHDTHLIHARYLFFVSPFFLLALTLLVSTRKNIIALAFVACYLISILLLQPQHFDDEYGFREISLIFENNNAKLIVYSDPFLYLVSRFYAGKTIAHVLFDEDNEFGSWAVIPTGELKEDWQSLPLGTIYVTKDAAFAAPEWQSLADYGKLTLLQKSKL